MVIVCCLQEVRWRGKRYKLWLSEKGDGVGGVGVMVEELCEKVVEVERVSDNVMTCSFL